MTTNKITGSDIPKAFGVEDTKTLMDSVWKESRAIRDYTDLPSETPVSEWGEQLMNYEPALNEFVNALVTRIGLVVIHHKILNNPLAMFKKGQMPLGQTIEDIYTDMAKSVAYDIDESESDVFKRTESDVKVLYHSRNRKDKIKATISEDNLQNAFTSWEKLGSFVASILQSMYNRNNDDEFRYMKLVLDTAISKAKVKIVKVPKPDSPENGAKIATILKEYSNNLEFNSREYNGAGVKTRSTKDDQFLLLTSKADAFLSVNVLASAFNMDKADFLGHKVMIDKLENTPNLVGLLIDRDFFMVYDQKFKMANIYNPSGLWTNYFLHVWQIMSATLFANAVAFVYDDATNPVKDVTDIVLSPVDVTIKAGESVDYTVVVKTSVDSVSKEYTIKTDNAKATFEGNKLTTDGALTSGTKITVTAEAKSVESDGSKTTGTATVTIE